MRVRLEFPVIFKSPTILGLFEIHKGQRIAVVGEGTERFARDVMLEPCRGTIGYLEFTRGASDAAGNKPCTRPRPTRETRNLSSAFWSTPPGGCAPR